MSIQTELTRITNAKAAIKTAVEGKGVTVPSGAKLDALAALIESIEAGGGGNFEVSIGIITPSEATTSLSWEHGLSKAPSFVMLFLPAGYSFTTYANVVRMQFLKYSTYTSDFGDAKRYPITSRSSTSNLRLENTLIAGDIPFTISDTEVIAGPCKFDNTNSTIRTFVSGKPYHWICVAGDIVWPYK